MEEFSAIRANHNTNEPTALDLQEAAYRNDRAFMNAINAGFGRMLDGAMLIRNVGERVEQRATAMADLRPGHNSILTIWGRWLPKTNLG